MTLNLRYLRYQLVFTTACSNKLTSLSYLHLVRFGNNRPGTRPIKDISIEFKIRPKFGVIWFKSNLPITTKFCTLHGYVSVVMCAKFRCDRLSICYIRESKILVKFIIRSKYRWLDERLDLKSTIPVAVSHMMQTWHERFLHYPLLRESFHWRHNERDGASNHQRLDCLISRLCRHR